MKYTYSPSQEKMEKRLEKTKVRKTTPPATPLEEKSTDSNNSLGDSTTSEVK
jgi:hypothetical protein